MQYVSHSSYLVSREAIARLIYIYETTVKQTFVSDYTKNCLRAQKFSGGHGEQLIKRNSKCCPPTFHDLNSHTIALHSLYIDRLHDFTSELYHLTTYMKTNISFHYIHTTQSFPCHSTINKVGSTMSHTAVHVS